MRAVQANERADLDMSFSSHIPSWYWLREMIGGFLRFKRILELAQNRRLLFQPGLDEEKLRENMQTSVSPGSREEANSCLDHSCSVDPFSLGAQELFKLSLSLATFYFYYLQTERRIWMNGYPIDDQRIMHYE